MNDFKSQIDGFFSGLDPEEREKMLSGEGVWKKQTIPCGKLIFEEGAESSDLYLILNGEVEITKQAHKKGQKKVLAILDSGTIFGEGALLSDKPRSASATALTDVEALVLSESDFDQFLKDKPDRAASLLLGLLKVVNQRLQLTSQELVTLYEVTGLMRDFKDDRSTLILKIGEKLSLTTAAPRGLIMLNNIFTERVEVMTAWGGFALDVDALRTLEEGDFDGRIVIPIRNMMKSLLGWIVMEKDDEWTRGHKKMARTIAEQLGLALEDYQFMTSEAGRSKLKQQNVQF